MPVVFWYRAWKRGRGVLIPQPSLCHLTPNTSFLRTASHAKTSAGLATRAIVKSRIPSRNFVFSQDPHFHCVKSRTESTLPDHVDME